MYRYIYELKHRGALIATGEAQEELADESLAPEEDAEETGGGFLVDTETKESTSGFLEEDNKEEEPAEEETSTEEEFDENSVPKDREPVSKIQTLDIVNMCMTKFDKYMNDTQINWSLYINNGKVTNTQNFTFIDDIYNLLNNTLDEKTFEFLEIYNTFFNKMTDTKFTKDLSNYGREKYGKPFLAEGLALLLYELSVDWAVFLCRYFRELPELSSQEDSFVRKFPNLRLLTYIAKLFNDSNEFGKLITNAKAKELLTQDTKYAITAAQAKKKPRLYRANGESLSYFASLIRFNFADIMVGAIDKLGTVAFLNSKCTTELHQRLTIIPELIKTVVNKNTTSENNNMAQFVTLESKATDILKSRSEARIILESNEKNFPMKL